MPESDGGVGPFCPGNEASAPQDRAARRHFDAKERCIWCDIVAQEVRAKERIVLESDHVVALSPWAARSPFELWILPRAHRSSFQSAIGQELRAIGDALRTILRKVDVALEKPAFNLSATRYGRSCERSTWPWRSLPSTSSCTRCRCGPQKTTSITGIST